VIEYIFSKIGKGNMSCCEFGAWDGIHFSNTRNLVLEGWRGLFIECDKTRFELCKKNYGQNDNVVCLKRMVDDKENSLEHLLEEAKFSKELDFLSVDIDGLDFEILKGMTIRPRVICIEVNPGHSPTATEKIPTNIAMNNVGQPFVLFADQAKEMGYALVCYTGNAFLVRLDCLDGLRPLSVVEAYDEYIANLDQKSRDWMYLVNKSLTEPFYPYGNPKLSGSNLGLNKGHRFKIFLGALPKKMWYIVNMKRFTQG